MQRGHFVESLPPASSEQRGRLDEVGYVMLEGLTEPRLLESLRRRVKYLFGQEGAAAGAEFKQETGARRLANLVNKGDEFREVVNHPRVLACVAAVLGRDFKLSSCNARSANPGTSTPQPLHCDMGALPDARGFWVCNAVWMLDDFTAENGALRVVPGSHHWQQLPQQALADPSAPHPDEIRLTGKAGSVIVMNAHLWHGGLANRTTNSRTAVHAFYCRGDKPQQQYQKRLLDPALQDRLTEPERELLALDDPLNDELSRSDLPRSGFLT